MPLSSRPGISQIARLFGATGQQDGIVLLGQGLHWNVHAHMRIGDERDTLRAHLLNPAIDNVLLQLEVGNAVAQQPANAVVLLVHGN